MRAYGRLLLAGTLIAGSALQGASVEAYLAAFEREAQRLAASPSQFAAGRSVPPNRTPEPQVNSYELPGIDRPGDIYHIRGTVFLSGARLEQVTAVARAYGKHNEIFGPRIAASTLCSHPADNTYIYRYWTDSYRDSVSETRAVHRQHDPNRYSVSTALTGIGGTGDVPGRDKLCKGTLKGTSYMKDLRGAWRYEQVAQGVWIESDMVAVLGGFSFVKAIARRSLKELVEDGLKGWKRRFTGSR